MENVEKIREGLYIKHSKFFGSRVIYPIKNDDGSINWFNILTGGSYGKLLILLIILFLIFFMTYSYMRDVKLCREILINPIPFCLNATIHQQQNNQVGFSWDLEVMEGETG